MNKKPLYKSKLIERLANIKKLIVGIGPLKFETLTGDLSIVFTDFQR